MILFEENQHEFQLLCQHLHKASRSKSIFLINVNGQIIATAGATHKIDTTSMASLLSGAMIATGGLAQLVGEDAFPSQYYEGEHIQLYCARIGKDLILSVMFDEDSSLGLVRMRTRRIMPKLQKAYQSLLDREASGTSPDIFKDFEVTDDSIDQFFGDLF